MSKISFSEYKKKQIDLFWDDIGVEQEMKIFQAQYDDNKRSSSIGK